MMTLYEVLGIKKEASAAEVKRAYRHKAQKTHPDKKGGSAEKFNEVKLAYDILSDEEKRAKYDRDGTIDTNTSTIRSEAIGELANLFMQVINRVDFKYNNLIEKLKEICIEQLGNATRARESLIVIIERNKSIAERMKVKDGKDNIFIQMLDADSNDRMARADKIDRGCTVFNEVLQILVDYEYTVDERQTMSVNPWEILDQLNKQSNRNKPWTMS